MTGDRYFQVWGEENRNIFISVPIIFEQDVQGAFKSFQTFFVQAFRIVVDS